MAILTVIACITKTHAHTSAQFAEICHDNYNTVAQILRDVRDAAEDQATNHKNSEMTRIYAEFDFATEQAMTIYILKIAAIDSAYASALIGCNVNLGCQLTVTASAVAATLAANAQLTAAFNQANFIFNTERNLTMTALQDALESAELQYNLNKANLSIGYNGCLSDASHHSH